MPTPLSGIGIHACMTVTPEEIRGAIYYLTDGGPEAGPGQGRRLVLRIA